MLNDTWTYGTQPTRTLREEAAIAAMAAIVSRIALPPKDVAHNARVLADALVAELERTEKEVERG